MLSISGRSQILCDGIARREFLRIGGLALGGLSLPDILRAEEKAGIGSSHKSIIMVFLTGGAPQMDTLDPKPEAPREIRGEFETIPTNLPGVHLCEHMPLLSRVMDRAVLLRSVVGMPEAHSAHHNLTGRSSKAPEVQPAGGWPALGSVLSRLEGPVNEAMPPFVALQRPMNVRSWSDVSPGFLGAAHAPFKPEGDALADMVLNGTSPDRLNNRKALLSDFDRFRKQIESSEKMEGVDRLTQKAFSILTSSKLLEALDISREDESVRRLYGNGYPKLSPFSTDEYDATGNVEDFLVARRLVEAGVRCVTLNFGKWDTHGDNFRRVQNNLPLLDQGIAALIQDIYDRGLDKDVMVVVWGEFGRTPKINSDTGRDHWPRVMSVLLAGGGMSGGTVLGATDRYAGEPVERPIHYQQIFATFYHKMGIDPKHTVLEDLSGRPHYLIEHNDPIEELI